MANKGDFVTVRRGDYQGFTGTVIAVHGSPGCEMVDIITPDGVISVRLGDVE